MREWAHMRIPSPSLVCSIALLSVVLTGASPGCKESGHNTTRLAHQDNMKQIGKALRDYHDTFGHLPAQAICDKDGKQLLSWRVALLPFLEQDVLYKQFKLDEPWDGPHNIQLAN